MPQSLASILTILVGTVITIGGIAMRSEDVTTSAAHAVNTANLHQLATVVELYYFDHGSYPNVHGGASLIDLLEQGDYIRNRPLDPLVFIYEPKNNAQEYLLKIAPDNQTIELPESTGSSENTGR